MEKEKTSFKIKFNDFGEVFVMAKDFKEAIDKFQLRHPDWEIKSVEEAFIADLIE